MKVIVSGASGLVGAALVSALHERGDEVVRLVRREVSGHDEVRWNPSTCTLDTDVLDGADAVVNLSGASISRLPWTAGYKREILRSRIDATLTIVRAIRACETPPAVLINASAAGYYGSRPGAVLTDRSARGTGFLSDVVSRWERAAMLASDATRVVTARSGIVVAADGVLKPIVPLAKLGLAGPLGPGTQFWPWISLDDEVRAILHLIGSELSGAVNLVGPTEATADRLLRRIAEGLNRPYWLRAPRFAVEAVLGDAARDLLLVNQRIIPERLIAAGFEFMHPTVEEAVDAALASR